MWNKLKRLAAFAVAVICAFVMPAATAAEGDVASNTVALPQGVDIAALIQSGVVALAAIVAIALAAWASWLLVKKAISWVRRALS